jgi:methyltransferase (TIGR00027 family)
MKGNVEAGRSAYGAASMKATEVFVPERQRLFEDEIVMDFLPRPVQFLLRRSAIRAAFLSRLEASAPGIRGAMLCRTRRIDDAVRNAFHQGLPALVILGAGLDTRPYRFTESADANVVEIDLPSLQEFKKTCLLRKFGALPRHVRFVPCDLNTEQLHTALHFGIDTRQLKAFLAARGLSLRHDFGAEEHQTDYLRPVGHTLEVSEIERVAIAIV